MYTSTWIILNLVCQHVPPKSISFIPMFHHHTSDLKAKLSSQVKTVPQRQPTLERCSVKAGLDRGTLWGLLQKNLARWWKPRKRSYECPTVTLNMYKWLYRFSRSDSHFSPGTTFPALEWLNAPNAPSSSFLSTF